VARFVWAAPFGRSPFGSVGVSTLASEFSDEV
jgi:hypothetical protein